MTHSPEEEIAYLKQVISNLKYAFTINILRHSNRSISHEEIQRVFEECEK